MNQQIGMVGARVAFQGEHGAFSEEAAISLLGNQIELVPQRTFEMLFTASQKGVADLILAPLENSLMGAVSRCYDLLLESSLQIVAEVVHPISHYLIGCREASFSNIKIVESHPAALAQCENFFAAHPHIERRATDDTAASVRRVIERGDPTIAAIAGQQAATTYGGKILQEHLEDHRENYTRFVLLAPPELVNQQLERFPYGDKLSLVLSLKERPGALYHVLELLTQHCVELLKIEARPLKGHPWQYRFYLDLQASLTEDGVKEVIDELMVQGYEVHLLGCYPMAAAIIKIDERSR